MKAVFPGHPLVIAVAILRKYSDVSKAFVKEEGHNYANALEDIDIPGAGGCVNSALDAIRYVQNGLMGINKAVEWCRDTWDRIDDNATNKPDRYFLGIKEAEEYEAEFRSRMTGLGYAD